MDNDHRQRHEDGHGHEHGHEHGQFVAVQVRTTTDIYPSDGFATVPIHQQLKVLLAKAAHELGIQDQTGWVARVAGENETLDPEKTYEELGLSGKVEIDYYKSEGGGGCARTRF